MKKGSRSPVLIPPKPEEVIFRILDFDYMRVVNGEPQKELENDTVRIEFEDCYFEIRPQPGSSILISKTARLHPNTDQIGIRPSFTNRIVIS